MSYFEEQEESNNGQPPSLHDNLILDSGTKRLIDLSSRPPEQRSSESIEELISILQRKAPKLLDGLTDTNKVQIAKQCELKMYTKDEVVFHQGDEPDAYYTVIRGAVSIYALNSSLAKGGGGDKSSSDDLSAVENGRDQYGIFIAQLPPGESFGELSFNENGCHSRRNAGIVSDGSHGQARISRKSTITNSSLLPTQSGAVASDVCVLLLIPEKVYMSEMFARHSAKHQTKDKIAFLKESVLFKHWTMDQLAKMAYAMKKKQYSKGSVIIHQGERMEYLWIIKEGAVRVSHRVVSNQGIHSIQKNLYSDETLTLTVDLADIGRSDCIGLVESMDDNVKKSQREAIALTGTVDFFFVPLAFFRAMIIQDIRTYGLVEKVAVRRLKWESLRREYAIKFPKMSMSLPKDASLLSNYALDGCYDLSSKSKNKASKGRQTNDSQVIASGNGSGSRRGIVDGLMRKNRENTIAMLVAEAGL